MRGPFLCGFPQATTVINSVEDNAGETSQAALKDENNQESKFDTLQTFDSHETYHNSSAVRVFLSRINIDLTLYRMNIKQKEGHLKRN